MYARIILLALAVACVSGGVAEDITTTGFRMVIRLYEDCQRAEGGFSPCLKKKAIAFFDRASKVDTLSIGEGISAVKTSTPEVQAVSENELDATLPRSSEARDEMLTTLLIDRVSSFFNSRTLQVSFPKLSSQELGRGLEEGRGKMKKMMGMMAMGFAMKMAAMVPVAIAGLFLLAGKALIVSKIALLLSGIIALKKLLQQKQSSGGHESHGWSSGGGGGGSGGWDRRAIGDSSLAYSSYTPYPKAAKA